MRSPAQRLAAAFLAGPWDFDQLVARGAAALERRPRWLRPLVRRLMAACEANPPQRLARLAALIDADGAFQRACDREEIRIAPVLWDTRPEMQPVQPAADWRLPDLVTPRALADWLGVGVGELEWFADWQGREARTPSEPLRHYRYRWAAKRRGSARLIETPKPRLKAIQRRLLRGILDVVPPHDAAHGFRSARSIRSFSAPHAGRRVVIRLDLQDFFPSIRFARVEAVFAAAGYPEIVARLLAGLCTNCAPADAWRGAEGLLPKPEQRLASERRYRALHLPQGAPTSPALANLAAFRLDCRLAALARASGGRYTRYADDLAFSGDEAFSRSARRFVVQVAAVALEEGFRVEHRKTRIMRQSVRQRLAGVVVNQHPNAARQDYDRLKATLFNCVRHGPAAQNRDGRADFRSFLAGRIAHVSMLNPARGERLKAIFSQIRWQTLT